MLKIIFFILAAEILAATGHILFKRTTNRMEEYNLRHSHSQVRFIQDVLMKPAIWLGFITMTVSLVMWLLALAMGDLSFVYPIGSIQYIFILVMARIFLGEKIDRMKLIGTLLVVFGVALIAMS